MEQIRHQALYESILHRANLPGTFSAENGIRLTAIGDGWAEGTLDADTRHMNPMQIVHGGCLCTVMDQVCGAAACSRGSSCLTVSCDLRYLCPGQAGTLRCRAEAVHMGRGTAVFHCWVKNPDGSVCANGTYTFRLKPGQNA